MGLFADNILRLHLEWQPRVDVFENLISIFGVMLSGYTKRYVAIMMLNVLASPESWNRAFNAYYTLN